MDEFSATLGPLHFTLPILASTSAHLIPATSTSFVFLCSMCAQMNLACKMLDRIHAVKMFQHLEESNDRPNEIGFLSLLSACGHAGLVEEGNYVFARMLSYSVKPNLKHCTCMVDLLGRSGNLQQAEALVLSMIISPYGGVWGNLFSRCRTYNQVEKGIRIAMYAIDSEPENDGYHIILANMYSSIGRWEEEENVRRTMKERCSADNKVGWSLL
ncbi:hypothetical protein JHK82_038551 [Glycine max]|nr:hypothetical protein JHK82_038551 [Glycine max]KAG5120614.1 hypothetical protein JHK84_038954 [Glycine max]